MNLPAALPAPDPSVRTFGPARHRRVAGLHVLSLEGSVYEMARQHGALLAGDVRRGPVPYYRTYIDRIMRTAGLGPLAPLAGLLIRRTVGRRVAAAMPPFARDAIRGLADGSGMSEGELLDGCTMPDSLLWVVARMMQLRGVAPAVTHRLALGFGCTSALAWGDATADGRLLHARNFDYHGVDTWPRTAAVAFHAPDDGQRYVSVTAAGVLMGGVTAMNEAGLTLTVHQHMFSDGTRLTPDATPIGLVGDLIMRHARDLDEAQTILERHRSIGAWTYLIGDARGEVLCFEENPDRQAARRLRDQGTFGYANIYLDPELGETERDLYGSYWRANLGRQQRADELLAAGAGAHDPESMAGILADTGGDGCRLRRPIAMLMTVASVVFRPGDGVLWVATGEAPTSHNAFEPFALDRRDHAPEHGRLTRGIPDAESAAAFEAYRRSYLAYFDRDDLAGARTAIEAALEARPDEPLYQVTAGMLALQAGDSDAALASFGRALALGHPDPQRTAAAHLWHGRAADLAGKRDQARRDYRTALGIPADAPVRKAARRGLRRPYRTRDAARLAIDYGFADVVNP